METTTLVTFFLDSAPKTQYVDLYGSWDNFRSPRAMQKDRQTGHGRWTGCHRFQNIICDGDPSESKPGRDGCLMAGGTYWYYYKLNGDTEYHDPLKPSTSHCPLLPGQAVNILDVPLLMEAEPELSLSDDGPFPMTLNPDDRRRPLRPRQKASQASEPLPHACRDVRREAYISKGLGRLHTATAHLLMLTSMGYTLPLRKRGREQPRPTTAGGCLVHPPRPAQLLKVPSLKRQLAPEKHSLPRKVSTGRREEKRRNTGGQESAHNFPNPFTGDGNNGPGAFSKRSTSMRHERTAARPLSLSAPVLTSWISHESGRPSTAPLHLSGARLGGSHASGRHDSDVFGDIQLRIACAKLPSTHEGKTASTHDTPWDLGRVPHKLSTKNLKGMEKGRKLADLSLPDIEHDFAAWSPETVSPFQEGAGFWGTSTCGTDCDSPQSPVSLYHTNSTASRRSTLYALGGNTLPAHLADVDLGSQETIRPARPPSRTRESRALSRLRGADHDSEPGRDSEGAAIESNDLMKGDFSYLGAAGSKTRRCNGFSKYWSCEGFETNEMTPRRDPQGVSA